MTPGVEVEVLVDVDRLAAIRGSWDALWSRCPWATAFQRPEWLLPWARRFAADRVHTLAAWRGGALVGLLPLIVEDERLAMLGVGVTDRLDLLVAPENGRSSRDALLSWLCAHPPRPWLDLEQLAPGSPLLEDLGDGREAPIEAQDVCPVLALPDRVEALPGLGSAGLWANVRLGRRRLERAGEVRWDTATAPALEALFRLHAARWRGGGALADERVRGFHREVADGMARVGALLLHVVQLDGEIVAVLYGFRDRGRVAYYLNGFDPAHARLGLGSLLVAHAMEAAIREGALEFDFLRGAEPYKYAWGAVDRVQYRRRLALGPARSPTRARGAVTS